MANGSGLAIVWLRRDLRLRDNRALTHAVEEQGSVVPVFVYSDSPDDWPPGVAKKAWLARSLGRLDEQLRDVGLRLVLKEGDPADVLAELSNDIEADAVYATDRVSRPKAEAKLQTALEERDISTRFVEGRILHDPSTLETKSGGPYHVFTPFWRRFLDVADIPEPVPRPDLSEALAPPQWPESIPLDSLFDTSESLDIESHWTPGEAGALDRLEPFVASALADYPEHRNRPDIDGTSRLSPHLHYGEISPATVWKTVEESDAAQRNPDAAEAFLRQIGWREFSYHLLHHYPETSEEPLKSKFRDFPWESQPELLERWKQGRTGYPIVDAGMRQLKRTGWMHNRVRMIVASFLTKDLRIPWQDGARWFWERLVDADLANNTMGWQWSAGCGADAQPFFRVFNPTTQSERYDPDGDYIRTYVPELADLPDEALHAPAESDDETLRDAGVRLGKDYPEPLVDHAAAREEALAAWERIK